MKFCNLRQSLVTGSEISKYCAGQTKYICRPDFAFWLGTLSVFPGKKGRSEISEPGSLGEECQPDHASPSKAPWGSLGSCLGSLSTPHHCPLLWPHLALQSHYSLLDCISLISITSSQPGLF